MKIVLCGVWHVHAEEYYTLAKQYAEVLGVWDEESARKTAFAERFGLHAFADLEELLGSGADAAIVCTSTAAHADLMVRLAAAKMDIFTEKVLALTVEDCDRVARAVEQNGVRFVISLVQKYMPGPRALKAVVDAGEIGKLSYLRFHNSHSGSSRAWLPPHFYDKAACGGGAMIDLGAHGMYLIDWMLGVPTTVRSVFGVASINEQANCRNSDGVEDNAVTVMGFDGGVIAVNETGFVSAAYPMTLEADGSEGWVRFDGCTVVKCVGGKLEQIPLPDALPSPLEQFLTGNILPGCGIDDARALTHLMVEAYR